MNIDIDFEVYKLLTSRLESEQDTYNEVVRRLLSLPPKAESMSLTEQAQAKWFGYDVALPVGTQLRTTYKKSERVGIVRSGGLEVEGQLYPSLSAAAIGIVGQNTNGWTFWKYYDLKSRTWKPMMALR